MRFDSSICGSISEDSTNSETCKTVVFTDEKYLRVNGTHTVQTCVVQGSTVVSELVFLIYEMGKNSYLLGL